MSLALLVGGCLQTEHTLDLRPDGSGTMKVRYAVPAATMQMMGDSAESRFDEEHIREEFSEKEVPGVALLDVRVENTDGGQQMELQLGFDRLAAISRTEFYQESSLALRRTASGTYHFSQMSKAPRTEVRTPQERNLMKGFRFTMNVTVPGAIVKTNADTTQGQTARWIFDLDSDPHALERMDAMAYEIEFTPSAPGLPEFYRPQVRLNPPPARLDPLEEASP